MRLRPLRAKKMYDDCELCGQNEGMRAWVYESYRDLELEVANAVHDMDVCPRCMARLVLRDEATYERLFHGNHPAA